MNHPTLAGDLTVMWIFVFVIAFALMFAGALSLQSRRHSITVFGGIALLLIAAAAITLLQVIGVIGLW